MSGGADLHVHTTHSDGSCSPGEVVRAAAGRGLAALAITDHDTLSGLSVARPEAARLGVELVSGVELTAVRDGREIHILGYYFDDQDKDLVEATTRLRAGRADRIASMVDRLRALGLSVDLEGLAKTFPRATLGRRHLADWLVKTGQVADRRAAFDLYLRDDGPATVPKPRLPWREAIGLIRAAGGVAAWAHPPFDARRVDVVELIDGGLGAIEVDGPGFDARRSARLRGWAVEDGLIPVAGTDVHTPDRPGRWLGAVVTPVEDLERLRGVRPGIAIAPDLGVRVQPRPR